MYRGKTKSTSFSFQPTLLDHYYSVQWIASRQFHRSSWITNARLNIANEPQVWYFAWGRLSHICVSFVSWYVTNYCFSGESLYEVETSKFLFRSWNIESHYAVHSIVVIKTVHWWGRRQICCQLSIAHHFIFCHMRSACFWKATHWNKLRGSWFATSHRFKIGLNLKIRC